MIELDLFGLLLTAVVVGPRQAHLVVLASLLQEALRVLAAVALRHDLLAVMAGGAFGATAAEGLPPLVLGLAGPALLALVALNLVHGRERLAEIITPWRESGYPFAAVALRLAVLTAAIVVSISLGGGGP
ncbi:MAG TPA: hypothetical protein VGL40_14970 [Bacillota bacterium]|jgi:hypothetical protein